MKQAWQHLGYSLAIGRPSWLRDQWCRIWYRFYCPRPIIDDPTAKACIAAGYCGCDNRSRYPQDLVEPSNG